MIKKCLFFCLPLGFLAINAAAPHHKPYYHAGGNVIEHRKSQWIKSKSAPGIELFLWTPDQIKAFLDIHNTERAKLGVDPLKWDQNLANYAYQWSKYLALNRKSLASPHNPKRQYGENIWEGVLNVSGNVPNFDAIELSQHYTLSNAAYEWLTKEKHLLHGNVFNMNNAHAGHYTQMIWKGTHKVGAAFIRVKIGHNNYKYYVVANYDPAGNYLNERIY